jgi:hypothetical protein
MDKDTRKRLDEIQQLLLEKAAIDEKIAKLMNPQPKTSLPEEFSLSDEVFKIIFDSGTLISKKSIFSELNKRFPDYGLDLKQISSSLAYLKNTKELIESPQRGFYIIKAKDQIPKKQEESKSEDEIRIEDIPF